MASLAFVPEGVCSTRIVIQTDGDRICQVLFEGGCDGNLQGICRLAEGRTIAEVAALLKGIDCDGKGTSCPDQLARALERIQIPGALPK